METARFANKFFQLKDFEDDSFALYNFEALCEECR